MVLDKKRELQVENVARLVAELSPEVQERFLYMAQGAALVSNPPPKLPEASA